MTPVLRRALAAAVVVPALLALGACKAEVSAGGGYDPDDLAAQVQAEQEKVTPDLDVTDPTCEDVDGNPSEGDTIDCSVSIDGVEAPYVVTLTAADDDGLKFHLEPAQAIVSTDKVESGLEDQFTQQGFDVDVDCGGASVIVDDPGSVFLCTVAQDGVEQTKKVTVTIKDIDGNVGIDY
ncbi:hypothetical protein [Nocardioides mangrovi]|uniref:DUF4333 domain-containing protein n=1 Tax=Nocardioides mangrovi TaxID=2874580 RepID=A0ABS7U7X1_9ACTN|nr:hypothetical protein [Nocardioides mangrovi]MBZ5736940.1 hypothetical protein [Nocardioides mangrovi]